MRVFHILIIFLFSFNSYAQEFIHGRVIDGSTKEPLAFVNILFNEGNNGVSTDIDGKFEFKATAIIKKVIFSYIGYEQQEKSIAQLTQKENLILLKKSTYDLNEVVILPGINPAHRIIDLAIENRKINNPELATEFFYESYNKLTITGEADSNLNKKIIVTEDTSSESERMQKLLQERHLFIMESVTERSHIPPANSKEVVKASRVSGLKSPTFSLIGTQLQSFSLYQDYVELFGLAYLSPLSKGSTFKYLFILEDTLYSDSDTIFRISYRPRKGKNFEGLKGVLSINTNRYAVQNFIGEPLDEESVGIKIQQKYQFINNRQWFPVQLNTFLVFNDLDVGNTKVIGIGKSYIKNIKFQSPLTKKEIGNTILKIDDNAGNRDSLFWSQFRTNDLDQKEQKTYQVIDSVGKKAKLDQKIAIYKTLLVGHLPIGPIDLVLKNLIRYNGYEGFRLGLGIETNEHLLGSIRVGGYGGYGFKDKTSKYGTHIRWLPKSNRQFETKITYSKDVVEVGGVKFNNQKYDQPSSEKFRDFFINRMDEVEKYDFQLSFRALRDFHFTFFGNQQLRTITSDYAHLGSKDGNEVVFDAFNVTQAGINVRYKFREKFVEMFGLTFPVPGKTPTINLEYTHSLDNVLESDFQYHKLDMAIDQQFKIRNIGETKIRIAGGLVDEIVPISLLYRTRGIFNNRYSLASAYNFETIGPNEFFSDRYVNVFFRHSFKNLLFKKGSFKPIVVLVSSFAIGDMMDKSRHQNIEFNTLEQGFFESGIQFDNLLRSMMLGIGAFYRYGAYSNNEFEDNIAVKLTSTFSF